MPGPVAPDGDDARCGIARIGSCRSRQSGNRGLPDVGPRMRRRARLHPSSSRCGPGAGCSPTETYTCRRKGAAYACRRGEGYPTHCCLPYRHSAPAFARAAAQCRAEFLAAAGRKKGGGLHVVCRWSHSDLQSLPMPTRITGLTVRDIRFPTSRQLDGSDAMNVAPDYSAAYVVLRTDRSDGVEGHGLTFTTGRGTEVCVAAVRALERFVVGRTLESIAANMGGFWREITGDPQLRWIGPDKGAMHLATAAVVNAVWDLWAKAEGKPVWKLLVDMTPGQLVECVDFRYITDAITPDEAVG